MKYLYINLDGATERRAFVESNFATCSHRERAIERVPAIDVAAVEAQGVAGSASLHERACYLSHMKALDRALAHDDDVLIAEDDVLFSASSTRLIEQVLPDFEGKDWDLVYTDLCIPRIPAMLHVFRLVQQANLKDERYYQPLGDFFFAGSTSYIVNKRSKQKLKELMIRERIDRPHDLAVRDQIAAGQLNAFVILPFATSLSKYADATQIQPGEFSTTELAWNTFRRLMWHGRNVATLLQDARTLDAAIADDEKVIFSWVLKAALSDGFGLK